MFKAAISAKVRSQHRFNGEALTVNNGMVENNVHIVSYISGDCFGFTGHDSSFSMPYTVLVYVRSISIIHKNLRLSCK